MPFRKNIWNYLSQREREEVYKFAETYRDFLSRARTERETVNYIRSRALERGFVDGFSEAGDRMLFVERDRLAALYVRGKESALSGFRIVASHTDAPRLDLKPVPLYEDSGYALLDTQYYGGVKYYQWFSLPLAIHGVVVLSDGSRKYIVIGEDESEPVFVIPDLEPHLDRKAQRDKKLYEALPGEKMDIIFSSVPLDGEKEKAVKKYALRLLKEKYGIGEEDFVSADIEIVPAIKPRDVGLDGALIGGYAQDDRICVFTSLMAALDMGKPDKPALVLFVDKEEIGSEGNTSAQSAFIKKVVRRILEVEGTLSLYSVEEALYNSEALSADVTSALNPLWKEVHDEKNAAKLHHGIVLTKYTGRGGKYVASEASAEFVGRVRTLFEENGIYWQPDVLGRVDEGGGGTIAMFLARYGMEVLDAGPALLAMHSPFEISSKADLYMAYRAYKIFMEKK